MNKCVIRSTRHFCQPECLLAQKAKDTCNTGHSPVVSDPTTTPALTSLSIGERTGSRVLQWVWSHVLC
ncbi:hypothetical protein CLIM01_07375 [Colletotrichum limetticola]|uniref:Uncharacterized protein n=1 Tax=Colletotrichum limetticola TaxID=1209924 RepID=A0ABQ9PUP3_9PEZI|nr:hypothetical protein CLIM01_07375 [Colletotrichum limetticola]